MAKKVRRKAAAKTKVRRAKAKTTKTKAGVRAKPKAKAKSAARTKKAVAKRKSPRTPRPKEQSGILATVTSAFQTVTDSIRDTALLRKKMQPPGTSETG